jgi:hypothetical protein
MRIALTRKTLIQAAMLGTLLALGACDNASSTLFDNNCSGNAMIQNPDYCTGTLHPNAGPWSGGKAM